MATRKQYRPWLAVRAALKLVHSVAFACPHRPDACLDVVVSDIQPIDRPAAPAAAPAMAGTAISSVSSSSGTSAAAPTAPAPGCYSLPLDARIVVVDSEEGVAQLEAALFGGQLHSGSSTGSSAGSPAADPAVASSSVAAIQGPGRSSNSSGSSGSQNGGSEQQQQQQHAPRGFGADSSGVGGRSLAGERPPYRLVVGIDCEWQPYERGQPKSSVSLLQLATPGAVFLLDMLALCGAGSGSGATTGEGSGGGSGVDGGVDGNSRDGGAGSTNVPVPAAGVGAAPLPAGAALQPLQRRLSLLLGRLWGDAGIVKAGFGLSTDLQRLCESYPWLPCFGSAGPVPLQ